MGGGASNLQVDNEKEITEEEAKAMVQNANEEWDQSAWDEQTKDRKTVTGKEWNEYSLPRTMSPEEEASASNLAKARTIARRTSIADATSDPKAQEDMTKYMATRGRGGQRRASAVGTDEDALKAAAAFAEGAPPTEEAKEEEEEEEEEEEAKEEQEEAKAEEAKEAS
jgi:hypothetical protein